MVRSRIVLISFMIGCVFPTVVSAGIVNGEDCGNPNDSGGVGPYDWNDSGLAYDIWMVEKAHFTPFIEELAIYGSTVRKPTQASERYKGRQSVAGNLDYTLRAIPNQARALYAMGAWQLRLRQESFSDYQNKKDSWRFRSAECYFDRALQFRPNDANVHLAHGIFLYNKGDKQAALSQYLRAVELAPDAPEAHYNLGLLYVELGNYQLAREHADKAYELNYPLTGLRDKLARLEQPNPASE